MEIIEKIKKGQLNSLKSDELVDALKYASDVYYNQGKPVISDDLFDIVKEKLKKISPKNEYLKEIGAPEEKGAINLPYWTGSLDKIKDDEKALDKWKKQYEGSYAISDKLDGNSGLLVYENDKVNLYSRGDGYKGQNLNHVLKYLNLPEIVPKKLAVRGELIISKNNWEKISHLGANARNVVAGVLHSKIPNPEIAKYVEFVAYQLFVTPQVKPSQEFVELEQLGFKIPYHTLIESLTMPELSEILMTRRGTSEYEIDGIVVTHNEVHKIIKGKNPKYSFAFKSILTHDEAEAIVESVEWNISKDGLIKPTVLINPIALNGVKISRATGYNASFIEKNNIGPGARIIIIRSGDVIPKIIRVVTAAAPQMPEFEYKWNETHVDIFVKKQENAKDNINLQIDAKTLEHFVKKMDIKFIAAGTIKKLMEANVNTIPKLLKLSIVDLMKIEGFQKTSAEKVYNSIQESIKRVSTDTKLCVDLMAASNLFGSKLGSRKIEMIIKDYPDILSERKKHTKEEIMKVKGIASITADAFLEGILQFYEFLDETGISCKSIQKPNQPNQPNQSQPHQPNQPNQPHQPNQPNQPNQSQPHQPNQPNQPNQSQPHPPKLNKIPSNEQIVFTGFRNKDWERLISDAGSKVSSSISKNVTLVVASDPNEKSAKLEKAKELKIKIISKKEFATKYNLNLN